MKTRQSSLWISLFAVMAMAFAFSLDGFAQQTPAGTEIKNQSSAAYRDSRGATYNIESNMVAFTVAKVAGLTITPDGQTGRSLVLGERVVRAQFQLTNTGNFRDQAVFLANGKSVRVVGPATITRAYFRDLEAGALRDIHTNAADVTYALEPNASITVTAVLDVNNDAAVGSTIQVFLGDATTGTNFDNVDANNSANEVRTVSTGAVNGSREARGDISFLVRAGGQLRVNLTAPPGPVALGQPIKYTMNACNDDKNHYMYQVTFIAPIPSGTVLTNVSSLPSGTKYTTSPLSLSPLRPTSASWVDTAPRDLSTVARIWIVADFFTRNALAPGACTPNYNFEVTVTTENVDTPIYGIVDAFALNSSSQPLLTDQSGDNVANRGDGNANFDEPVLGALASPTQGFQQPTALTRTSLAGVLIGPDGAPNATGPTNNNDDYTNLSTPSLDMRRTSPGGLTVAPGPVVFTNTLQNKGTVSDTFTLTAPTIPAGAVVEISTDGGAAYTPVGGSNSVNLAIIAGESANIKVKIALPARKDVLTGYDTVIRAVSQYDSSQRNETINRVYTGFIRLSTDADKSIVSLPGTVITYRVRYENISSTGGNGSIGLTATNLIITKEGNSDYRTESRWGNQTSWRGNNWGTMTDHVPGSAVDSMGGTITGDTAGSTLLTVTIPSLPPGASGTFTFKRKVK